MKVNNFSEIFYLNRITAITLLVRLENGDIPYAISKQCREELVYYLSYILTNEDEDNRIVKIKYEDLQNFVEDIDSAIKIIGQYRVFL